MDKARAKLQAEHRGQTAKLVELRAKVTELDERRDVVSLPSVAREEEVLVLHAELA